MSVKVLYVDSDGMTRPLDNLLVPDEETGVTITIDVIHAEIHDGHTFTANRVVTLPLAGTANVLIVTADTPEKVHITYQVISNAVLTVNFYESPDYAGGSALPSYNRRRDALNNSNTTLTYAATDSGGGKGTLIWTFKAGANKLVTASESTRLEFILKRNCKYLLESVGVQNDLITFLLDWYEHSK
ncbi:MAG: hypothetical protein WC364_05660 [Eubacteriales bacterium]|jgi:hypothetical protein